MEDRKRLAGAWDLQGLPLEIRDEDGTLLVHLPGAPDGFDPVLEPARDGRFVLRGGSFDGAVFELSPDDEGPIRVGPMELTRIDAVYEDPPGYGLLAPEPATDDGRDRRFAELEEGFGDAASLEWDEPHPKHEFVQWLTARDRYIFHGSNNQGIDEFAPVRTSMELYDHGERGNLGAVYGTHFGLWSMFFAIIDRAALRGSIRNGVTTFESTDGRLVDSYQFSVDQRSLPERPFTSGALYVLPRNSFRRLLLWPDGPLSNEWASEAPVRPLVRLLLEPEDFPFLDQIGAHDDGPLLRMQDLTKELLANARSAWEIEDGFAIDVAWSDEIEHVYEEWREIWQQFMPTVTVTLDGSGDTRHWTMTGPDAFRSTAKTWLADLVDE